MKIVLDSNVLMSAFGSHGLCEDLMVVCLEKHEIALSEYILEEVGKHLKSKFKMPAAEATHVIRFLRSETTLVEPALVESECRDPKDIPILGTAKAAKADFLCTGDKDLLVLRCLESVRIVSPRELYEMLG